MASKQKEYKVRDPRNGRDAALTILLLVCENRKKSHHAVREVYAGGQSLDSPLLSPLFGDFQGFPPTLVQVGSNEILYSDSLRLRERMEEAGTHCRLEVWEDMWHVFQMFPIRRATQAMDHISRFLLEGT